MCYWNCLLHFCKMNQSISFPGPDAQCIPRSADAKLSQVWCMSDAESAKSVRSSQTDTSFSPPTHPRRIFSPQELVKCGNQIRSCEQICQKTTHSLLQTNKVSFRPPNQTLIGQILKFPSIWFTNPVLTKMKYFLTIIVLCLKPKRCQQWALGCFISDTL